MPRKRRRLRTQILVGRPRMSDEMESFLAGDDSVLAEQCSYKGLMDLLYGEKFFAEITPSEAVDFSDRERRRLDRLEERYQALRLREEHERCREMAKSCHVLNRYLVLLKTGEYDLIPSFAFSQALGPGPNSAVVNMPKDNEQGAVE